MMITNLMEDKADNVATELINMGVHAEVKMVEKNGIEMYGIMIGEGNVKPMIYINENNVDTPTKYLAEKFYKQYMDSLVDINKVTEASKDATDYESIKEKIIPCLMKPKAEYVTREFLDLKIYYRVMLSINFENDTSASFIIKPEHLKVWGVTEEDIYNQAIENTKGIYYAKSMLQIMGEKMGIDNDEVKEFIGENPMYVISNDESLYGAAGILDTDLLRDLSADLHDDLYIIPSSVHEVIVLPMSIVSEDYVNSLIKEVNETEVIPTEVLSDHVYKYVEGWEY